MSDDRPVLVVGDPHVTPEELGDCSKLLDLILTVCRDQDITEVWWAGDQHHTHAVLRLEVLHWWKVAFQALRNAGITSFCLVGNHDRIGPGLPAHALMAYQNDPKVVVVDKPLIRHNVLLLPFYYDEKDFQKACRDSMQVVEDHRGEDALVGPLTVFCHQTFDGSTYENGFPAADGFNPNLVPQELVISGHIHTGQEFGKVWYVGAPRWRSLSDANVERSIWVLQFNAGHLTKRTPFSTGAVCRQIRHLDDTPDSPVQLPLDPSHQWRIDIRGPADWCQTRKTELKAAGARVRTFPQQISTAGKIRESEGIGKAFKTFLTAYQAKHGTPRETLALMAKERLSV